MLSLDRGVRPALERRMELGAATEHLAIARLLALGHKVAVPVIDDDGVDLIVNYRTTVQVKSSGLWDVQPGTVPPGRHTYFIFKSKAHDWGAVDFWVFRGVGADRDVWWVVPREVLDREISATSVSVRPPWRVDGVSARGSKVAALLEPYIDAWHLFDR